jgi:hypothetical protein
MYVQHPADAVEVYLAVTQCYSSFMLLLSLITLFSIDSFYHGHLIN